jgi:hypothetical protein
LKFGVNVVYIYYPHEECLSPGETESDFQEQYRSFVSQSLPSSGISPTRSSLCCHKHRPGRAELLVMARFTLHSKKTMLKTTALQVILEFPHDITGQGSALLHQHVLKLRPVFPDQLIKQRVLWLMSLVLKWTCRPEIVLKNIGRQA